MKIGVIGHTQQVDAVKDLPARARLALAEVDLVLHVGNVGSLTFLRSLQDSFGLTFAVYGSQDLDDVKRYLEADTVVEFANRRIGLIFEGGGDQSLRLPSLKRQTIKPETLSEHLLGKFESVDCIVFGSPVGGFNHLHHGTLIFNPGPMFDEQGESGSMGILEITERVMTGRIILV